MSVLIATFNRAQYLKQTLQGLLHQRLKRSAYEIIVIDDGSSDGTNRLLSRYRGHIVTISKEHTGLSDACNAGLAIAQGCFVVRVDSDDAVDRGLLAEEKAVLDADHDVVCVSCDYAEESAEGSRLVRVREGMLCDLLACGVMMRLDAVRAVGGYRPVFWEELDLFIRLRRYGRFAHVPKVLYRYRRHPGNITATPETRQRGWQELLELWGPEVISSLGKHEELEQAMSTWQRRRGACAGTPQ